MQSNHLGRGLGLRPRPVSCLTHLGTRRHSMVHRRTLTVKNNALHPLCQDDTCHDGNDIFQSPKPEAVPHLN